MATPQVYFYHVKFYLANNVFGAIYYIGPPIFSSTLCSRAFLDYLLCQTNEVHGLGGANKSALGMYLPALARLESQSTGHRSTNSTANLRESPDEVEIETWKIGAEGGQE